MTRETKLILIRLALVALFSYSILVGQRAVEEQGKLIERIERQQIETSETIHQIKKEKVTTDTIKKTIETLPQSYRDRARHYGWERADARGGNWISRIDNYFARNNHAPLEGEGRVFYLAAVDAGINPTLMPAIAMIESGGGRANANVNNFFGRKAVGGGWASWATREEAIRNQAFYIARMWGKGANPYNMRGYCVPQFPWADKVAGEMARV